jgi:SAM-dependent methyltransferase
VVPDRHYGIPGLYSYMQCRECQLIFLNPMPGPDELSAFYPEETYYSFHADIYKELSAIKKWILRLAFLDFSTKDPRFENPGKILDIGCGNGWDLYQFKKKGWEVAGVEPSRVAADIGNKAELNIFNGDLLSARYAADSFDYVRSNHSFEHIHNPNEILQEIHRILKQDGKLFIGVPNIRSTNARLFKTFWYYLGAPVHTLNYSDKTLAAMLEKHGFRVEKVRYNATWAGILGSVQIYFNRNKNRTSDKGFLVNFMPLKMLAGFCAKIQNIVRKGDCIEITATKKM